LNLAVKIGQLIVWRNSVGEKDRHHAHAAFLNERTACTIGAPGRPSVTGRSLILLDPRILDLFVSK
jgi:hypothetical protein